MIFTQSQIQVPIDINTLLNTTADCLRFVTEFFEVISQSGPHIYHSALLLAPRSSVVWKLYGQEVSPVARVVTGIPASWDSCSATLGGATGVIHAAWSHCGQFIAVSFVDRVGVLDSTTLERVSDLRPPTSLERFTPRSIALSPDGHLLACAYTLETYDPLVPTPHIPVGTHPHTQVEPMYTSQHYCLGYPNRCGHQQH